MQKFPLGIISSSGSIYNFPVPQNTPSAKTNCFMLGKQGTGKSNLLLLFVNYMFELYKKTSGKHGCIPIIFAPTFEYSKLKEKSTAKGILPPKTEPHGIDAVHYSFKMAGIPPYLEKEIKVVSLKFSELTTEDIGIFANQMGNQEALGRIDKILEGLEKDHGSDYSVDHFLSVIKEDKNVYNALYYIFRRLKLNGLFESDDGDFDWETVLRERKPVCFHFGEIEDSSIMQALAGILLRKLFRLSNDYINAVYKKVNLQNLGHDPSKYMSERELWFLDNFVIGLFFEEAHQFFPPTPSRILRSFPAHHYFKLISMALGRKRNFKFNFLVSQRLQLIYDAFRTDYDFLFTGSKVDTTDKIALSAVFKLIVPSAQDVSFLVTSICANEKYEFTSINLNYLNNYVSKLQRRERGEDVVIKNDELPGVQFKAFLSPCGMY